MLEEPLVLCVCVLSDVSRYVWNTLTQREHDFKATLKRLTMAGFMFEIETTFSHNKPCGQRTDWNNGCWRYRSRLKIDICSS